MITFALTTELCRYYENKEFKKAKAEDPEVEEKRGYKFLHAFWVQIIYKSMPVVSFFLLIYRIGAFKQFEQEIVSSGLYDV